MYTLNNAIRHWQAKDYMFSACSGTNSATFLFEDDKWAQAVIREAKRDESLAKRIYTIFKFSLDENKWASKEPTSEIVVTFLYLILMKIEYRCQEVSWIAYQSRAKHGGFWILCHFGFNYLEAHQLFD